MQIPDGVLRQSHVARYGGGAFELIVGYDEPGCPRAFYLTYEKPRPDVGAVPLSRGSAIHGALELMESEMISPDEALSRVWPPELGPARYMESVKMILEWLTKPDDGTHTIASEIELTAPLYTDDDFGPVLIGGRIDRLAVTMDDPRTLFVDDYKSDAAPPSNAELEQWFQGYFYAELARHNAYRWIGEAYLPRIVGRYVALRHYTLERLYPKEEGEMFLAWAQSIARRILRDEDPQPVLNPGCHRCNFRMDCPAWLKLPEEGVTFLEKINTTTLEKQMAARPEANKIKNRLGHFVKGIDDLARDRLDIGDAVTSHGVKVSRDTRSQDRIRSIREAHELMGDEFYDRITLSKKAIEEYGRDFPEHAGKAKELLESRVVGDSLKWEQQKE